MARGPVYESNAVLTPTYACLDSTIEPTLVSSLCFQTSSTCSPLHHGRLFRVDCSGSEKVIVHQLGNAYASSERNGVIVRYINAANVKVAEFKSVARWTGTDDLDMVITYDGLTWRLYVDGVLAGGEGEMMEEKPIRARRVE